ncbi:MAG: exosortase/archaeosortase family protein [Chloroflexi bacterium]|nr:exosortase/archaeosortase family protein [Chloroflexota bacterium]
MTVSDWPVSNSPATAGRSRISLVLLLAAGLFSIYFSTMQWLFGEWWGSGSFVWEARNWAHGFLVVIMVGYLLWRKRREFLLSGRRSPWGIPALAGGVALKFAGDFLDMPYLSAASTIPAGLGAVCLFSGVTTVRRLSVPFLLFLLAVPFPVDEWGITNFLAQVVATGSAPLAGLLGTPVFRSGQLITVGQYQYEVIGLCSGFNFIMALLALAVPLLYLRGASLKSLGISLFWLPALGMAAKIILVSAVLALTPRLGQDAALALYHGWLGVAFFVAGLGVAVFLSTLRWGSHSAREISVG